MLQDFHFKIIHKLGNKHIYVNALSQNLVCTTNEEYFQTKVLDQSDFLPLPNQNCVANVFIPLQVGVGEAPNKSSQPNKEVMRQKEALVVKSLQPRYMTLKITIAYCE